MKPTNDTSGFTLIELMIVVAIIGILAAVAIPKFGEFIRKSQEAKTKGCLANLRGALSIYYADNEAYPSGPPYGAGMVAGSTILSDNLVPKYIGEAVSAYCPPYHGKTESVNAIGDMASFNSPCEGCWTYVSNRNDPSWGKLLIECIHTDTKGLVWSEY